jgi:hypothetical protein
MVEPDAGQQVGLALTLLHNLSGGTWGNAIRPFLEASARTLPWLGLFFVPLLFGLKELYPWTDAAAVAQDPVLSAKVLYLNVPFFISRAAAYWLLWCGLAMLLTGWAARYRRTGGVALLQRIRRLSAVGLIMYFFSLTLAAIDWAMSMEPHWFSTMYGFLFAVGQGLMALALAIVMARVLSREASMAAAFQKSHFHDLGTLLFAFTLLWAYLSFSQFLIIWSANLPEEIPWYMHRLHGDWQAVGVSLVVFHFAVPFLVLLSRRVKEDAAMLARVALLVILMRFVDLFYTLGPEASPGGLRLHWLDITATAGIGGIWLALFVRNLGASFGGVPAAPEQG